MSRDFFNAFIKSSTVLLDSSQSVTSLFLPSPIFSIPGKSIILILLQHFLSFSTTKFLNSSPALPLSAIKAILAFFKSSL